MSKPEVIAERLLSIFDNNKHRPMYWSTITQLYHEHWNCKNKKLFTVLETLVKKGKVEKINLHYGIGIKNFEQLSDPKAPARALCYQFYLKIPSYYSP